MRGSQRDDGPLMHYGQIQCLQSASKGGLADLARKDSVAPASIPQMDAQRRQVAPG